LPLLSLSLSLSLSVYRAYVLFFFILFFDSYFFPCLLADCFAWLRSIFRAPSRGFLPIFLFSRWVLWCM
jgi:hypothetical protein